MTAGVLAGRRPGAPGGRLRWVVQDALTMTGRNLIHYVRIPGSLFFSGIQPIMFVLLFRYVFGGAIKLHGGSYANYLIPGIFVQTVTFGAVATSIGLAEDLQKGLVERFRALPMARSALLAGRTLADLVRNVFVVVLITGVGYAVGFRVQTNAGAFIAGLLLILLFAFALSWGFAVIGLSAPDSETAQVMSFPILFPLTFASSAFVPVQDMPGWLQGFAAHQPISVEVGMARSLMLGGPTASDLWQALAWSFGLLLVLVPLAVSRFRHRTT
ncbi:MAG: ABC transporter permease [Actinomycetota bacterium]|nr:ABC transporter permease [Actinomycetota bacterium]